MKTQLLEDIGENAGRIVERLPLPSGAAPSTHAASLIPAPPAAALPPEAPPAPPAPPAPQAPPSARVWQVRAPRTQPSYRPADGAGRSAQFRPRTVWQAPAPQAAPAADPIPVPAAPDVQQDIADEVAEIERVLKGGMAKGDKGQWGEQDPRIDHEHDIAEELAAIERALQASEAAAARPAAGRRWLMGIGVTASVLLFAGMVAGTVQWYERESKNEQTLTVLATSAAQPSAARVAAPAPAAQAAPAAALEAAPPPMVMLEQAAPTPAAAPLAVSAPAPAPTPTPTPAPAATAAPAEPAPVAPAAPATPAPAATVQPEPEAPLAKPRRQEAVVRADAGSEQDPPKRPRPRPEPRPQPALAAAEPKPSRDEQMEETLRQCRAAGYHTAQCLEKKCQATRYGLACRG